MIFSCELNQDIQVGVLWKDDVQYAASGARYLGLIKGIYDFDTGFTGELLDTAAVTPGINSTYVFSVSTGGAENYTAFVFIDLDSDGIFDDGDDTVSGYKYNYGEPGEALNISVSAYY